MLTERLNQVNIILKLKKLLRTIKRISLAQVSCKSGCKLHKILCKETLLPNLNSLAIVCKKIKHLIQFLNPQTDVA